MSLDERLRDVSLDRTYLNHQTDVQYAFSRRYFTTEDESYPRLTVEYCVQNIATTKVIACAD